MPLDSIRETVLTLRESREAIHDGRIALAEARVDIHNRYERAQRRIDRVDHVIDLLQENGGETDLRNLLDTLGSDRRETEFPITVHRF